MEQQALLKVEHLKTCFFTDHGVVTSVDDVSFTVGRGETVAIVGESGCGKSVTSLSIMGLLGASGKVVSGRIEFEGTDLLKLSKKDMRRIRGNNVAMIFQEPLTSLNPVFTVGYQIRETILIHEAIGKDAAKQRVIELLKQVGIPHPDRVYHSFPHALSGGMRQRVMIAMAIACRPKLIIADEPTTALDVTIQAQILNILKSLKELNDTTILLITHDLGVVAEVADRVMVMYAGQIVEQADVMTLFAAPKHPYTRGLLNSTPKIHKLSEQLESIEGSVPNPLRLPSGCRFHPRCPNATDICRQIPPRTTRLSAREEVACWLYDEVKEAASG
ncbi:ABC transporter ATP-binding protein [Paenibacillus thalictri]|uniref:ABC transporter ATP-binding protein n=1 Tax=Paenibacillus thalictri TaxID=2527873 RepID=A0A4V2J4Q1_9BACL|nr:ABC transporter ATP-binding protein [Paenibacillus thalictri]TBL80722.1 ABC transporter ATP-binding protein [Paenibacillus thalictri]